MAIPITIPRLGWTMEEGVFVGWLKRDGETVRPGDLIYTLESDKATQEIECMDGGILRIPADAPQPGDTVAVGALLGYLLAPGEVVSSDTTAATSQAQTAPESVAAVVPAHSKQSPQAPARSTSAPAISPRARRVARELAIDWHLLRGSGRSGRIRERDVRAAATDQAPAAVGRIANPSYLPGRLLPLTPTRRVIAERLAWSIHTAVPVTLTTRVDATNLVQSRNRLKATPSGEQRVVPSYTDLIVKLTALALRQHPLLNAVWRDDGIFVAEGVHIGIAVETDAGLLVPVLRDVQGLSLRQIAEQSRGLIERARAQRLTAGQMQGGTFTVTNLGMYGIDAFTPLLNPPQCATLGVGRILREPAVFDGQIVPRDLLTLSLTFDHRVVDGAPAARFLQALRTAIEEPEM